MYVNTWNTSGLSFVYSCLSSWKQSVGSDGTYQEISLQSPSGLLNHSVIMFTNWGTSLVHSGDTWELNYGGNV